MILNTCSGASSQVWTPSTGHTLVNKASGLCLNAATSEANGTGLTTATCSSTSTNQQWWLPAV